MDEEADAGRVDRWFGRNGFTDDQVREVARLRGYAGISVEIRVRAMIEKTGMSPARALEEIRRMLKEEGEIPLNREV